MTIGVESEAGQHRNGDGSASDLAAAGDDECYRCGYSLRGMADDQPCPECGLLAERSRRQTDELHHSRPGWLRRLSLGVWLILLAMAAGAASPMLGPFIHSLLWRAFTGGGNYTRYTAPTWTYVVWYHAPWVGVDAAALILFAGVLLLSRREGYAAADRADAWRRWLLRLFASFPLIALALQHVAAQQPVTYSVGRGYFGNTSRVSVLSTAVLMIACAPGPVLLYAQLRSLAKRARSAHLAEHCVIVGVGNALTLLYVPALALLEEYGARFGLGDFWRYRSPVIFILKAVMSVLAWLFVLWNVYLLVRFAIAFGVAARRLRGTWRESDRSVAH